MRIVTIKQVVEVAIIGKWKHSFTLSTDLYLEMLVTTDQSQTHSPLIVPFPLRTQFGIESSHYIFPSSHPIWDWDWCKLLFHCFKFKFSTLFSHNCIATGSNSATCDVRILVQGCKKKKKNLFYKLKYLFIYFTNLFYNTLYISVLIFI